MAACHKTYKLIIFVMILLLLACSISPLLPHTHDCGSVHCVICALLEVSQELLLVLFLLLGAELVLQNYTTLRRNTEILPLGDKTLVALKVKLSN